MFHAGNTIFEAFVQSLEHVGQPAAGLYLVYPKYLFNVGTVCMFSRGVETPRIDG